MNLKGRRDVRGNWAELDDSQKLDTNCALLIMIAYVLKTYFIKHLPTMKLIYLEVLAWQSQLVVVAEDW